MSAPQWPPVSIVVATHNRRDWLRLAMDSVLEQDYADLELLVMDDGSTDATPELLRDYERRLPPERFRFSRHENMGQARTLNRGYDLARGELLGYLSDDDLLAPEAVTRLVRELADPEVVAAYPSYRIIDTEGAVIDTVRPIEYSPVEAFRLIETVIGPGCLVRRRVLESTGAWEPDLQFMSDFILWIKVGLAGRAVRVAEPLASWRRHGASLSLRVAAEHGSELLRLVERGTALLDLPDDAVEIRAEALRNACIQAAFFGGGSGASPGERFGTIDLTRPGTSALSSGLEPTEMPDERADRAAELWRELAMAVVQLARARSGERRADRQVQPGAGLEAALRRLRRVGAVGAPGDRADGWDQGDLRLELMEAAVECGMDSDPATERYLLLDRRARIPDHEFDELNALGYGAGPETLRSAIAGRKRELARLGGVPSAADR
ncbi:MAG TPA: glycosyltransferase [Solirubrobacterales bacterium]